MTAKMLDKYADDANYVTLQGRIVAINENDLVIECDGLKAYLSYEDKLCDYHVFSNTVLELKEGDEITFKTVPFHFYNGHRLPIVEVVLNEEILLAYDEGKENLIASVSTNH